MAHLARQTFFRPALYAITCLLVIAVGTGSAGTAAAQPIDGLAAARAIEQTFQQVIERASPAVVSIARIRRESRVVLADQLDPFGLERREVLPGSTRTDPRDPDFIPAEFGAGILIASPTAGELPLILTNYHVVAEGQVVGEENEAIRDLLYVMFTGRHSASARILAADPRSDLAVLRISPDTFTGPPSILTPLSVEPATEIRRGQLVLALGNPYAIARDGQPSASWGMVSNFSRHPAPVQTSPFDTEGRKAETIHHLGTLLHIDTRLYLGGSGGPLLDLEGRLIGITTSLAAIQGYEKSAGFAIPMSVGTRRIVDSLTHGWEVEYGFLGVGLSPVSPAAMRTLSRNFEQVTAAKIDRAIPNSPAAQAGLQTGDVLLAVDGDDIHTPDDLMREIAVLGPSAQVQLRVWRETTRSLTDFTVELGKWPVLDDERIIATAARFQPWRGLTVDFPTGRERYFQYPYRYHSAVVVLAVAPESPAARAGLQPGDFIAKAEGIGVKTPSEFETAVRSADGPVQLKLVDNRQVTLPAR